LVVLVAFFVAIAVVVLSGVVHFIRNILRLFVRGSGVVKTDAARTASFIAAENRHIRAGYLGNFLSGKIVLRIDDLEWHDAVSAAIRNVHCIVFDATDASDNLMLELETVHAMGCADKVFFISAKPSIAKPFECYVEAEGSDWRGRFLSYAGYSASWRDTRRFRLQLENALLDAQR
jgi:hypothetical protein